MTLSKREKVLLTLLALIGIYVGYYMYLVQPMLTNRVILESERQGLQAKVNNLEAWSAKHTELEQEIKALEESRATLESMALTEALVLIESTARSNRIKIRDISLKDVFTPTGGAFTASFSGTYRDIYAFVAALEAAATTFDIGAVRITGQGTELQASINATMLSGRIPPAESLPGVPDRSPFGVR